MSVQAIKCVFKKVSNTKNHVCKKEFPIREACLLCAFFLSLYYWYICLYFLHMSMKFHQVLLPSQGHLFIYILSYSINPVIQFLVTEGNYSLPHSFTVNWTLVISYPLELGLNSLCFMMPKLPFLVAYHHPYCILVLTFLIHGDAIPGI